MSKQHTGPARLIAPLTGLASRRGGLVLLCYLAALALWLVLGAVDFGGDALARANGTLTQQTLPLTSLQLVDLQSSQGWYTTTSGDPQIILEDVDGRVVRTLSYTAEFDGEPREACLYYTTAPGQPYSQDRRVFPTRTADGSYLYTLPRTTLVSLRLDPCSPDENATVRFRLTGDAIQLNRVDSLPAGWDYWLPSWYQAFWLILGPALAAACLSWLRAVWRALTAAKTQ